MTNWLVEELRVLVVDDDPASVALFEELLTTLGVESVRSAASGWEAIALMGGERVDLVICERDLPTMGGIDLTRYLRTEPASPSPTVPVLMIHDRCDPDLLIEARDAGINEFLLKPPALESLLKHIEVALNVPREFVRSDGYTGPSRRRGRRSAYCGNERRGVGSSAPRAEGAPPAVRRWSPRKLEPGGLGGQEADEPPAS